jgi:NAD(P)H-dependent flavin oxidoreductase YrpB (nitropropane dioxygenase family)
MTLTAATAKATRPWLLSAAPVLAAGGMAKSRTTSPV